mgnify:CR=1 FL=1
MNDPVANAQLELACRLGSVGDDLEAIDEGADVDCNGYSPLFLAIQNSDRPVIAALVERGADFAIFEASEDKGDVVDQLMMLAPKRGSESEEGMPEVDAKMVRAFDRMIRNKGFAEPVNKGRPEDYGAFREALKRIAAEECHSLVSEFMDLVERTGGEAGDSDGAMAKVITDADLAEQLNDLGDRYRSASEDEQPGELLKDYLKEQRKLA